MAVWQTLCSFRGLPGAPVRVVAEDQSGDVLGLDLLPPVLVDDLVGDALLVIDRPAAKAEDIPLIVAKDLLDRLRVARLAARMVS